MLKEQAKLLSNIAKFADLLAIFGAFALAYHVRQRWGWGKLEHFYKYLWVMLFVIPTWHFLLSRYRLYDSLRTVSPKKVLVALTKVHIIGGIIIAAAIYCMEPNGFSRGLFSTFLLFSYILLALGKLGLKIVLGLLRKKGFNFRNILIVGTAEKLSSFIHLLAQHVDWGLRIVGILHPVEELHTTGNNHDYKIYVGLDKMAEICKTNHVDEVVFCLPADFNLNVDDYIRDLEEMGVTVRMVLGIYEVHRARRVLSFFHDQVPILTFYSKAFDASQLFLKRCLDVVGAVAGLLITALLFPGIACAIKWDSPGPLLFGQERVRESGRMFRCWKFRSMYVDAEERKKELIRFNEMNGAIFKIKDDPRITWVGKFLRKTSLDEFPQFWNVLRGEMSLVGTRPPTPDEVAAYENWHRKRICIKPGITGLWQISGRNQIQDFDEVVRLDLQYIDQWSLWLDMKILLKTIWVVFARKGC